MRSLVIGHGSIGQRHVRILQNLGNEVAVLSRRKLNIGNEFHDLRSALEDFKPDYVVIANETVEHWSTLNSLIQFKYAKTVLVEKPLFYSNDENSGDTSNIFVGYNLRFHPLLMKLNKLLQGKRVLSSQAYVGKYLPEWRPEIKYADSYSAKKTSGGGVLRDLSHEIDYVTWMLGSCIKVTAIGGHLSSLNIDSDDLFVLMMKTQNCPVVTIQMNYLDRYSRRELIVVTDQHTYKADLIQNELWIDKAKQDFLVERDDTYRLQHEAILKGDHALPCTYGQARHIMSIIEAAEKSAVSGEWVCL